MKGLRAAGVVAGIAAHLGGRRRGSETGNSRKRRYERALALITGTAMLMSLMVVLASPALAHHPILGVSAVCDDQGNKVVTWTVANGDWEGRTMTVSQVQYTDGTSGWSTILAGLSLAPNGSAQESVTYGLSETGTKTLTVTAGWSGGPQGIAASLSIKLKELECDESTTTTTVEDTTTTTVEDTTTTTVEDTTTTTEASTTTTSPNLVNPTNEGTPPEETTSTVDDSVLGTVITTTVADEVEDLEVLPFTGSDSAALVTLAASAIALGAILVLSARREEH